MLALTTNLKMRNYRRNRKKVNLERFQKENKAFIMLKGIVKFWNESRGFGFIEVGAWPHDYDLFFHISSCQEEYQPHKGDIVMCIEDYNERGKFAKEVTFTGNRTNIEQQVGRRKLKEAREYALRQERECTCKDWDYERGKCQYCEKQEAH